MNDAQKFAALLCLCASTDWIVDTWTERPGLTLYRLNEDGTVDFDTDYAIKFRGDTWDEVMEQATTWIVERRLKGKYVPQNPLSMPFVPDPSGSAETS